MVLDADAEFTEVKFPGNTCPDMEMMLTDPTWLISKTTDHREEESVFCSVELDFYGCVMCIVIGVSKDAPWYRCPARI